MQRDLRQHIVWSLLLTSILLMVSLGHVAAAQQRPRMVIWTSDRCANCRELADAMATRELRSAIESRYRIHWVNADAHPLHAALNGVRWLPTIDLPDGRRIVGFRGTAALLRELQISVPVDDQPPAQPAEHPASEVNAEWVTTAIERLLSERVTDLETAQANQLEPIRATLGTHRMELESHRDVLDRLVATDAERSQQIGRQAAAIERVHSQLQAAIPCDDLCERIERQATAIDQLRRTLSTMERDHDRPAPPDASEDPETPPLMRLGSLALSAADLALMGLGMTGAGGAGVLLVQGLGLFIRRRHRRRSQTCTDCPAVAPPPSGPQPTPSPPPPAPAPSAGTPDSGRDAEGHQIPEIRVVKVETRTLYDALEYAHVETIRRYPGSEGTVQMIRSLVNQYLSSKGVIRDE